MIEGALEAFCTVSVLAGGGDGLIEEDVANVASKLVEKFLVKLLEGRIGRR